MTGDKTSRCEHVYPLSARYKIDIFFSLLMTVSVHSRQLLPLLSGRAGLEVGRIAAGSKTAASLDWCKDPEVRKFPPVFHSLHPTPYTLHPTPHTLHPAPYLHPTPYTLHPAPHTLHPTPFTLHPTPFTPHPTPYTPHPTPHTLHPTPYTSRVGDGRLPRLVRGFRGAKLSTQFPKVDGPGARLSSIAIHDDGSGTQVSTLTVIVRPSYAA